MAKLTDTQSIVLSEAAGREDGVAIVPEGLNKAAASRLGASLLSRKLMREVRSKSAMPVWREDDEGRGVSLVITREGREALGPDQSGEGATPEPTKPANASADAQPRQRAKRTSTVDQPQPGSKQALLIKMLSRKSGATMEMLIDATGWLPHTTRAALTGLRRRGFVVALERQEGKPSLYRITSGSHQVVA